MTDRHPNAWSEALTPTSAGTFWTRVAGEGPALILLHGGPGADSGYLRPLGDLFAGTHKIHTFDQRACGRSEGVAEGQTFEGCVDDVDVLRAQWRLDRAVVVGHSWGGTLALGYALRYPTRVAALVLIGRSSGGPGYRENRRRHWTDDEAEQYESLRAQADAASDADDRRALLEQAGRLSLQADMADYHRDGLLPAFESPPNLDVNRVLNADTDRWRRRIDWPAPLSRIDVPTLILHGEADPGPADANLALARQLPRGRFVLIDGAGHFPWIENPDAVRGAVDKFLSGVPSV